MNEAHEVLLASLKPHPSIEHEICGKGLGPYSKHIPGMGASGHLDGFLLDVICIGWASEWLYITLDSGQGILRSIFLAAGDT